MWVLCNLFTGFITDWLIWKILDEYISIASFDNIIFTYITGLVVSNFDNLIPNLLIYMTRKILLYLFFPELYI